MKKSILGILTVGISIVGFSNAVDISCNGNSNETNCTPYGYNSPYVANEEITVKLNSVGTCYDENLISIDTPNSIYGYSDLLNGVTVNGGESISFFYYTSSEETQSCQFNVSFGNDSEGGGGNIGGIIEGGTEAFSGIITKLSDIFGEFGPYIIYIAIACLGVSLLFKALRYILGFTNNSAKNSIRGRGTMQERRRRRRKMRRYKRTEQEARKYYDNDNYDRDEAGNGKLYRRSRKNSKYLKEYRYGKRY